MKIKKQYVKRNINNKVIIVPIEKESHNINGIIELNDTAAFLWEILMDDVTELDLVKALIEKYLIGEKTAKEAVNSFKTFLSENNILE